MIGCFLITHLAFVNFLSRPFGSLEVFSVAHLSPRGLSALHSSGLAVMDCRVTFNLLGIVDDEIAVPYDGEVHCQVTDLHTLVHVLQSRYSRVRECAQEERKSEIQEIKRRKKNDRERQKGGGGGGERMKVQPGDEAFNHLSFLPWLSAPLLSDMWGHKP